MEKVLFLITEWVNNLHDVIIKLFSVLGFSFTDNDLHFIVMGGIGITIYILVDLLFKAIAKLNVSIISFLYTFTLLVVIVFGLEIEQKITGRGNMEFSDVVAGLWGFLVVFAGYVALKLSVYLIKITFYRFKR